MFFIRTIQMNNILFKTQVFSIKIIFNDDYFFMPLGNVDFLLGESVFQKLLFFKKLFPFQCYFVYISIAKHSINPIFPRNSNHLRHSLAWQISFGGVTGVLQDSIIGWHSSGDCHQPR